MVIVLVVVVFGVVLGSYFIFWVGCLGFGLCLDVLLGVFTLFGVDGVDLGWDWFGWFCFGGVGVFLCVWVWFRFVYCFGGVLGGLILGF